MEARMVNHSFTYQDYLSWPDRVRCELIDGVVYNMAPAPSTDHQRLSGEIHGQLWLFLRGKPCEVFSAPFDVRFSEEMDTDTVVQPDILVLCDREKITDSGAVGAPELVIEILSPSTTPRDTITKRALYERKGVLEYWIVSPVNKTIYGLTLSEGIYKSAEYTSEKIASTALPGFEIDPEALFAVIG